jgi:hypothetical protein
MQMDTKIGHTPNELSKELDTAKQKAAYDDEAKRLLAIKSLLATILIATIDDFSEMARENVEKLIDTPVINLSAVPGETNQERITGTSQEDAVPYEGKILFDIRFAVYNIQQNEFIKFLVNIEMQKSYYPGYDLVTRGIFYAARMISSQLSTEFSDSEYNHIKKVYSIWICLDSPKYAENTITRYKICPEQIVGCFPTNKARFDLLEVIMICLSKKIPKTEENFPLHRLLNIIFSETLDVDYKKTVIKDEFNIPITKELDRRLAKMCNLSEMIEEKGIQRGIEQQRIESIKILIKNYKKLNQTIDSTINAIVEDEKIVREYWM